MEFLAHGVKALYSASRSHPKQKHVKHYLVKLAKMRTSGGLKLGRLINHYWKRFNNDNDLVPFKISFCVGLLIFFYIIEGRL